MFQMLKQLWQGSDVVEFESAYGMDESLQRLKSATRRQSFFSVEEGAVGTVSESRVSLQRVVPMVRNSFKPFFVGHFEHRGAKVILTGRFRLNTFVKVFLVFWMGMVGFMTLTGALAASTSRGVLPLPLMGAGMLIFAVLLTAFGGWLSRSDPAWLSAVIQSALNSPRTEQREGTPPSIMHAGQMGGRPWAILKVALLFTIFGALLCVSAITGIQAYQGAGSVITRYHDPDLRYMAGTFGVILLGLSYGVYQRYRLAWQLVFLVIGAAGIVQLFRFLTDAMLPMPYPIRLLGIVFASFIMVMWGRWWYAQRVHFRE
jgi:hypothetical protein